MARVLVIGCFPEPWVKAYVVLVNYLVKGYYGLWVDIAKVKRDKQAPWKGLRSQVKIPRGDNLSGPTSQAVTPTVMG